MGYIYEPEKDKGEYSLPIHTDDFMMPGFTYQQIIDNVIANQKVRNEDAIKEEIHSMIHMVVVELWDSYELVKENLLKEVQRNDE